MRYEHKTIPLSEIGSLNEHGSEGWKLQCQVALEHKSILILVREVKTSVRAEKKASYFPEYLEFRAAYPRKD